MYRTLRQSFGYASSAPMCMYVYACDVCIVLRSFSNCSSLRVYYTREQTENEKNEVWRKTKTSSSTDDGEYQLLLEEKFKVLSFFISSYPLLVEKNSFLWKEKERGAAEYPWVTCVCVCRERKRENRITPSAGFVLKVPCTHVSTIFFLSFSLALFAGDELQRWICWMCNVATNIWLRL